jgi:uncharacterized membrane protein YphA (DoxX/SURF4 family)
MSSPSTNPNGWGVFGPDPGLSIRVLVALLLRFGIGLSLLNTGLMGYMNVRLPGGGGGLAVPSAGFTGLDPLMSAIPYLAIGLGLALILGFLMTPTSVAAGFFGLLTPLMTTVAIISNGMAGGGGGWGGPGRFGGDPFGYMTMIVGMSTYLPAMIPQIALIWLSPVENHPYSVDALIFGRNPVEIVPPAQAPMPVEREPTEPAEAPMVIS